MGQGIFMQPSWFNRYHRIVHGEQLYMCNKTRALTKGFPIFNDYQSTFNGERSNQCNESWKNFNQGSNPNKHQRTRLPENHYKCGKDFDQSSNLIHQNIHIVEKIGKHRL